MNLTFQLFENFWFSELGCEPSDLKPGRTADFPHGTLKGYSGVIAFFRNDTCIVSAPEFLAKELREKLNHVDCVFR
jgi:hypothetical protein